MRIVYKQLPEVILIDNLKFPDTVPMLEFGSIHKVKMYVKKPDGVGQVDLDGDHRDVNGNPIIWKASRFMLLSDVVAFIKRNKNKKIKL